MLITRFGNETVMALIEKSNYGKKEYFVAISDPDDLATVPEIPYDKIDDVIAVLEHAKKAIEEEMEITRLIEKAQLVKIEEADIHAKNNAQTSTN